MGQRLAQPWVVTFLANFLLSLACYSSLAPILSFDLFTYVFSVILSLCFWYCIRIVRVFCHPLAICPLALIISSFQTLLMVSTLLLYREFREFITADMLLFVISDPRYLLDYVSTYFLSPYAIGMVIPFAFFYRLWTTSMSGPHRRHDDISPVSRFQTAKKVVTALAVVALMIAGIHNIRYANAKYMMTMDTSFTLSVKLAFDYKVKGRQRLRTSFSRMAVDPVRIDDLLNIILVINESWAKTGLSFYGRKSGATPFLDWWIGSEKDSFFIFQNAFSNSTATDISVPSMLTGVATYRDNETLHKAPLVWDWAKAAGYSTILVSSQRYTWNDLDKFFLVPGPDYHHTAQDMDTPVINDMGVDDLAAVEFFKRDMEKVPRDKPVLAIFNSNALHSPYQQTSASLDAQPKLGSRYDNGLFILDSVFKRIYENVRDRGQLDNTVFIFVSDHSHSPKSSDHLPRLYSFYDESIETPMLIRFPPGWIKDNARLVNILAANTGKLTANIDLVPTIIDLLGLNQSKQNIRISSRLEGKSLLRRIEDDRVVIAVNTNQVKKMDHEGFGIFTGSKRFVFSNLEGPRYFDVTSDPDQNHDIWPETSPDDKKRIYTIIQRHEHLLRVFTGRTEG